MNRDDAPFDRLLQPGPLKHRGLEDRGRCIGVVFEQFCISAPVVTEVQPSVQTTFIVTPARRDQRPDGFRYFQPPQGVLVIDHVCDEFEAHGIDLGGRALDVVLDVSEAECVIGAFVPIAFAVDSVKIEPASLGRAAPVMTLGTNDPLHRRLSAAAMTVTMTMATVAVEAMNSAAETAM